MLILNKSDLVDASDYRSCAIDCSSSTRMLRWSMSCWGDVNPAMIFDVDDRLGPESNRSALPSADDSRQAPHTHAHDRLWSRTIRLPQVLDRHAFIKVITSLPSSIFRVKGLIELSAPRQTTLLQYVAGRWDITPFPDPQAEDRFLTFIGKTEGPNPFEAVEALIRAAEAESLERNTRYSHP